MLSEDQILLATPTVIEGGKLTYTRKQLAQMVGYWATRCAYEADARMKAQQASKQEKPSLVLPPRFSM